MARGKHISFLGNPLRLGNYRRFPLLAAIFLIPLFNTQIFFDNFAQPKWLAVYWLGCASILTLLSFRKMALPMFSAIQWGSIAFWLALLAVALYRLWPLSYKTPFLDRVGFVLIAIYSYQLFKFGALRWEALALAAVSSGFLVASLGLFQAIGSDFSNGVPYFAVSSTFGHANMAAEFLGICLLFSSYLFARTPSTGRKIFFGVVSFVLATYILVSGCRSVLLALLFALLLVWRPRSRRLRWLLPLLSIVAVLGLVKIGPERFVTEKSANASWRAETWKSTVALISDHPNGLGVGKYEFGFVSYRNMALFRDDKVVERSPHNEFLRFLAEDGIIASVLGALSILVLLFPFFNGKRSMEKKLAFAFCGYMLVQMFFQFPFENAVPFLFAAIFLGYMVTTQPSNFLANAYLARIGMLALGVFFVGMTYQVSLSKYLEANNQGDRRKISRACALLPTNWRICLEKAKLEMEAGAFQEAEVTLNELLWQYPHHFTAAYYLGVLNFKRQNYARGCAYFSWYNRLFQGKMIPEMDQYCVAVPRKKAINELSPLGDLRERQIF
ncbi:MAG: O-antigen ligase family protein [Bacteriovoracia bacterium]